MTSTALTVVITARPTFEGHELTEFRIGRVAHAHPVQLRLASQVAIGLGYADPIALQRQINDSWSGEMREGEHFVILRGEDLRPFKDAGLLGKNANSAMALTPAGVVRVLMLSGKPKALPMLEQVINRPRPPAPDRPDRPALSAAATSAYLRLARDMEAADPEGARELRQRLANGEFVSVQRQLAAGGSSAPRPSSREAPTVGPHLSALLRSRYPSWLAAHEILAAAKDAATVQELESMVARALTVKSLGRALAALARNGASDLKIRPDTHTKINQFRLAP